MPGASRHTTRSSSSPSPMSMPAARPRFGAEHGCRVHETLEALLADPDVQLVVNLTVHHAHFAVSRQALEAGKHVYSEKPMALEAAEARQLVDLAERQGLRLACAPSTFLGEAQQTAGAIIAGGELGTVRAVYADVNWGRIETLAPGTDPLLRRRRPRRRRGLSPDHRHGVHRPGRGRRGPRLGPHAGSGDHVGRAVPDRQPRPDHRGRRAGRRRRHAADRQLLRGPADPRTGPPGVPRRRRIARHGQLPGLRRADRARRRRWGVAAGAATCASPTGARTGGAVSPTWRVRSSTGRRSA